MKTDRLNLKHILVVLISFFFVQILGTPQTAITETWWLKSRSWPQPRKCGFGLQWLLSQLLVASFWCSSSCWHYECFAVRTSYCRTNDNRCCHDFIIASRATTTKRDMCPSWTWSAWCQSQALRTVAWPVTRWDSLTWTMTKSCRWCTGGSTVAAAIWSLYDLLLATMWLSFLHSQDCVSVVHCFFFYIPIFCPLNC